jgi:hypothetical protein
MAAVEVEQTSRRRDSDAQRQNREEAHLRVKLKGGGGGGGMGIGRRRGRLQQGKLGSFVFICSIIGGLGEGKMGCWQAGPDSCLRSGHFRAAPYRAVFRAGPTGRDGGPGTKRSSGRAGTRHY